MRVSILKLIDQTVPYRRLNLPCGGELFVWSEEDELKQSNLRHRKRVRVRGEEGEMRREEWEKKRKGSGRMKRKMHGD